MKRRSGIMACVIALSLACLLAGCEDKDVAAIERVSQKALDKAASLAAQAKDKAPLALPATATTAEPTAAEKATKRLRWDRDLADAAIEVRETPEGLILSGSLPSDEARRRAVSIAESTVGVKGVTDRLVVKEPKAN